MEGYFMIALFTIVIAYLIGSVSSSIIASRLLHLPDPRTEGSKNAGATNMMRLASKKVAVVVMIGDILKGVAAVVVAKFLGVYGMSLAFVALASVVGHIFPIYFQFKGGKGVATMLGALLALSMNLGLIVLLTWLIVAFAFRYSSLASIVTTISAPIYTLLMGSHYYFIPVVVMAVIIVWKHKGNIERLRTCSEHKLKI
jgi:acyl phosphate:glycerol-3-phosphate acyltransferase